MYFAGPVIQATGPHSLLRGQPEPQRRRRRPSSPPRRRRPPTTAWSRDRPGERPADHQVTTSCACSSATTRRPCGRRLAPPSSGRRGGGHVGARRGCRCRPRSSYVNLRRGLAGPRRLFSQEERPVVGATRTFRGRLRAPESLSPGATNGARGPLGHLRASGSGRPPRCRTPPGGGRLAPGAGAGRGVPSEGRRRARSRRPGGGTGSGGRGLALSS
jgi:hypothetical protein